MWYVEILRQKIPIKISVFISYINGLSTMINTDFHTKEKYTPYILTKN